MNHGSTRVMVRENPGLTSAEVLDSRKKHGANVLTPPKRTPWYKLYFEKFDDPVIRILLIAAAVASMVGAVEGSYVEGIGILCAVFLSTALAFANEFKAAREFELLNKVSDDAPVRVLRDGQHTSVPRKDIVVGDVVIVETGAELPADGDVLEAVNLRVDESGLTGESFPAPKAPASDKKTSARSAPRETGEEGAYPPHRLMRGTLVSEGYGTMRVTEVGDQSEAGRTAHAASEESEELTPLGHQLARLARVIGVVGFTIAGGLFAALIARGEYHGEMQLTAAQWRFALLMLVGAHIATVRIWLPIIYDAFELAGLKWKRPRWLEFGGFKVFLAALTSGIVVTAAGFFALKYLNLLPVAPEPLMPREAGHQILEIFMVAVTVVVVAVPEGLAMSVTLCLAYSVRRMAATNNLVRRMHACETIGAATVICSDKTGTLTLNQMRVAEADFLLWEGRPGPQGIEEGRSDSSPASEDAANAGGPGRPSHLVLEAIALNSTADLAAKESESRVLGNPTEGALLMWVEQQHVEYTALRANARVISRLPFSTEHKFMCSLVESTPGKKIMHVKGAPEVVLGRCATIRTASGTEPIESWRAKIEEKLRGYQARGMRTLGFAYKECDADCEAEELKEKARELIWLGCTAIQDPVRAEVPAAIEACQRAGIAVKMVTGDNAVTAKEISRQAGLWKDNEPAESLITGPDFANLSDEKVREVSQKIKIMARARPTDKLRLVKTLKAAGHVVAVTGDGTNDAPALNHANVGLAMGKSGSATAKEASDIILLDDSFTSIVNAVKWGRSLYDNIRRFIVFQLTINVAALGLMVLGPFVGIKLPLTVTQMLWINLIMDTMGALALASEPPHDSVLNRPPRAADAFIISGAMARNILGMAVVFLVTLLGMTFFFNQDGEMTRRESTIVFTTLVMLQFWNLFNARCFGRNVSALAGIFHNKWFVLICVAIMAGQFLIVQFGGNVFRTEPLAALEWVYIAGATSAVLWAGEVWRLVARAKGQGELAR